MEGADIYQIAKNCRTSVEMIEKYYASHIKTSLDAAAINVRRPRPGTRYGTKSNPALAQVGSKFIEKVSRGRGEMVDATDLSKLSALAGNPRRRTAQSRGNLSDGNPEPSPKGKV